MVKASIHAAIALALFSLTGCATTSTTDTSRTGIEQLLVSNSIDQALDKVDFRSFRGQNVYLEEKYIDCVDKSYLVASIRHRVLSNGGSIVPDAEKADLILEARSGAVGTDRVESFFGTPAIALPGPVPLSIPEIKLFTRNTQYGTAKIGLVAYDAKTYEVLGSGGMTSARSDDTNWFVLGVGPWKNGNVQEEVRIANNSGHRMNSVPRSVAFGAPDSSSPLTQPGRVQVNTVSDSQEADWGSGLD